MDHNNNNVNSTNVPKPSLDPANSFESSNKRPRLTAPLTATGFVPAAGAKETPVLRNNRNLTQEANVARQPTNCFARHHHQFHTRHRQAAESAELFDSFKNTNLLKELHCR